METLELKVHQHEIILDFFDLKSLYALRKFLKKISPEFPCLNISSVTEHTRNQIFFERYPNFFLQNLHFGPIRLGPRLVFKTLIFYRRNLHFNRGF
jgi:hypothetical protein